MSESIKLYDEDTNEEELYNSIELVKLQNKFLQLQEYAKLLNKQIYDQRNLEINNLVQSGILIGYQHTTRQILQFALESQPGQSIDLQKANLEFFRQFK